MIKRHTLELIAVIVFVTFFCQPSLAKEDTAQISLKKTAVSKQNIHLYKVKKGDVISAIIRRFPGITEDDIPDNYRIIKELNPSIENLNKLYAGQIIKLPGKIIYPFEKNEGDAVSAAKAISTGPQTYMIKKGDSLIIIIHRELKIKTDTMKTVNLIKSMNPRIADVDKIYAGQIIKLPGKTVFVKPRKETKTIEQTAEASVESQIQPGKIIEIKEMKVMPLAVRLAVIKHIITQMNGSVSSSGNYYLPFSKSGQVTIDCSKIPVIEFADKTIVFLDWENRLNDNLKKMIHDTWSNFSVVKVDKKDDVITLLKKIIAATKAYSMTPKDKPVTTGSLPPVEVAVDWMIFKTDSKKSRSLMQALRFVSENKFLLPKAIKNYAQQNGLIITEIDKETGIAGKAEEIYSLSPMPFFPTKSVKDFSYALITHLGFTADKDAAVKVFDMAKDGFNLSIKADVLIKNDDKKYIVYSRNLPQQFINVFKGKGYGLIFVAESDSPKIIMEKILSSLAVPSAYGYFTFSGPDKNQAPYTFGFTGMKIKTGKDQYVIDFAMDDGLRGLLSEVWQANFARY